MRQHEPMWGNGRLLQSIASFVIAALITALLLFQLVRPWQKKDGTEISYVNLDLSLLNMTIHKSQSEDKQSSTTATDNASRITKKTERLVPRQASAKPQQPHQLTAQAATEPEKPVANNEQPAEGNSGVPATLQIGKEAIARAYADSRRDMQKTPDQSRHTLEAAESSKNEQFAQAISKAKIEGCIKPNPNKGITIGQTTYVGYLAVAALAYNAMTGKCK